MPVRGATIRARRLALGQDLDEVARATRIPLAHLEALEDDRLDDLPAGPYAAAYTRTLARHLGLDASSEDAVEPRVVGASSAAAPLWLVRTMAIASLLALLAVVGSAAWDRFGPSLLASAPQAARADQRLVIEARRSTWVTVAVDGGAPEERSIAGGERLELVARERLEVSLAAIGDVRLEWNGETVVPQGRQDAPRRLVFVDDAGGAW